MAEESDLSRTEPASSQRLQQARSAGDVPRSGELTAWIMLLAALGSLSWLAPRLFEACQTVLQVAFSQAARPHSTALIEAVLTVLWTVFPVLGAIFISALVAPVALSGWVFAPQRSQFDLAQAHPFKSLFRLFSVESLFDGALALLKLALIAAVLGWTMASGWPAIPVDHTMSDAIRSTLSWIGQGVLSLAAVLALVAALDAGWRWWRYLRRHAMTWQEVLAEARESEGSPEMRAQLRGRHQQAGQGTVSSPPQKASRLVDEVIG